MRSNKSVESLRWIGVVPAAVLGGMAAQFATGRVGAWLRSGLGMESGSSGAFAVQLILFALTAGAFVLAGGFMAPHRQARTAFLLAIAAMGFSLLKHVLLQSHPGWVNYCHLAAETFGSLAAAGWVWGRGRKGKSKIE